MIPEILNVHIIKILRNSRSSAAEDSSLKERKTQDGWSLIGRIRINPDLGSI